MAPSNKCVLVLAVLLTFATLQQSAAIRAQVAAAAPAPAPGSSIWPQFFFPCIPGLPRLFPCYQTPPSPPFRGPQECRTPLMKMMSCAGYLTNSSVLEPSCECCKGYDSIGKAKEGICYCHLVNGDFNQLLPPLTPMITARMFNLTPACNLYLKMETYVKYCNMDTVPPMTLPGPPPSGT
ncbi:hypothetical protein EJB05_23317 [Eragrostis curvula]|uniref:Bifunctional inhibitor/plant lipid transfer protein/seed storage helical domain-containing protein n=1 Tax=Eragrostis curvula TaxID=38414 RepID=A0A5J9V5Y4_9POAL|nr:hypothetical protein EJB05_23296 [Eragrostis curvula]TVU31622.1 hypothetical protein EJB05_23317 [Eragrostis curvula]